MVERLLVNHGVTSAPVPIEDLARALGAEVHKTPVEESLSGFLYRENATGRALIGANSNHHRYRQRFTIGHELGHFLLHADTEVHVDRADGGFQIKLRSDQSSTGTDVEEIEANVFAAELLMPASFLYKDLAQYGTLDFMDEETLNDVLTVLAEKYEVSKQALTYRLVNLEYVHL